MAVNKVKIKIFLLSSLFYIGVWFILFGLLIKLGIYLSDDIGGLSVFLFLLVSWAISVVLTNIYVNFLIKYFDYNKRGLNEI